MANENLDSIGSDSGQARGAARTAERFPIEYELITDKEVEILRPMYLEARTAERVDGPAGAIGGADAFLAMGVPQAQIMMYQQTMRAFKSLEDKLDDVLKAMGTDSSDDKKANKAMCVDLSSGGMRMITAQKVKRGALAKLTLTLPPLHPVIVVAVGKIVKASPIRLSSGKRAMETAIAFEVINENDREEIVAYSFKRQRQEAARAASSQDDDDY
ncbi:MAG: PilZ domain-containing protein [Nitrospinaceae bacterium]|jgi:hypothetical protein|nr:PilZ domain-containing protein [Nitrospinaceae bacterium]MBT3434160.1 PilZ domain-containing protein [Nitrospinaceae bacterium]MBT4095899.1 PilZ domain-containing protein [Nitrospinaceae bacterium]MBT4432470.1 PilZ domain-containing protein [Nitrospinaceae bacterium]MBT5367447.1 PilZ domain-containing protein [Nitrospinaceae bacterium]